MGAHAPADTNCPLASSLHVLSVFQSFYGATELASTLVSEDGKATILSVMYDFKQTNKEYDLVNLVSKKCDSLLKAEGLSEHVDHGIAGLTPFATAILDGVQEDLHFMGEQLRGEAAASAVASSGGGSLAHS